MLCCGERLQLVSLDLVRGDYYVVARTDSVTDHSSRDCTICLLIRQLSLIDWHIGKVKFVSVLASLVYLLLFEPFVIKLLLNDHFYVFDIDVGNELLNWICLVFLAGVDINIRIGMITLDLLLHLQKFLTVLRVQPAVFVFPHAGGRAKCG